MNREFQLLLKKLASIVKKDVQKEFNSKDILDISITSMGQNTKVHSNIPDIDDAESFQDMTSDESDYEFKTVVSVKNKLPFLKEGTIEYNIITSVTVPDYIVAILTKVTKPSKEVDTLIYDALETNPLSDQDFSDNIVIVHDGITVTTHAGSVYESYTYDLLNFNYSPKEYFFNFKFNNSTKKLLSYDITAN